MAEAAGTAPVTPEEDDFAGDAELKATTKRWILYDAANSVYSTVGIGGYIPLLVVTAALRAAQFPGACENVSHNITAVHELFPWSDATAMHYIQDPPAESCPDPAQPQCVGSWCVGEPATVSDCLLADGVTKQALRIDGFDPNAFTTLMISCSVAVQAVMFVVLGGAANHPARRHAAIWLATGIGALTTMAFVFMVPDVYWLAGILVILSNAAFGYSTVAYNAYLPGLVSRSPAVQQALPDDRAVVEDRVSSHLSNHGFAAGYFAGVGAIILTMPLVLALSDELLAYRLSTMVAGAWWAVVGWYSLRGFSTLGMSGDGSELPAPGKIVGCASLKQTWTLVRQLPQTAKLLGLFFFYSDGVFVISSIGALFAASEVRWGCIPKSLGVAMIFLLVPLCGAAANHATRAIAHKLDVPAKVMVICSLLVVSLLAIYGLLGFASDSLGVHTGTELLVVACIFGAAMATMQAFSRALLVCMTPVGHEASVMALYEVSDKGSSWLGPLVIAGAQQATGELRYGFVYILVMTAIPAFLLWRSLDEQAGAAAARAWSPHQHGVMDAESIDDGVALQDEALGDGSAQDTGLELPVRSQSKEHIVE